MIGCRTINIPEIILGVHGLVGFTVTCNATLLRFKLRENLESSALKLELFSWLRKPVFQISFSRRLEIEKTG